MSTTRLVTLALASATLATSACFITTRPAPQPGMAGNTISWSTNLSGTAGGVGSQFVFMCPAGGSPSAVWGTDIYSDDSSVCTAAVHAGVIGWGGGVVRVVIQPGQSGYMPSYRNGVNSSSWGSWGRSFSFF